MSAYVELHKWVILNMGSHNEMQLMTLVGHLVAEEREECAKIADRVAQRAGERGDSAERVSAEAVAMHIRRRRT